MSFHRSGQSESGTSLSCLNGTHFYITVTAFFIVFVITMSSKGRQEFCRNFREFSQCFIKASSAISTALTLIWDCIIIAESISFY